MDEDKIPTFWSRSDVAEILKGELLPDTDANIDIVISDRETIDRLRNACHNVILEGVARLAEEDRLERHPVSLALEDALLSRGDVEVVPIEFINDLIEGGPQHWSLALGIFAAEEPGGGFTVAYNNTGDCFTETFATLAATLAYINGDEIEECYRIDRENRVEEGRLDPLPVERIGFDDEVSQDGDHLTFLSTANFDTERVFGMRADYIRIDYDPRCHGLAVEQVKRIPELLERPVLMCDSPAREDVLLSVLCAVDSDHLPLIAAIKPGGSGYYEMGEIQTNFVLAVYGRTNFPQYLDMLMSQERLVYYNEERGRELNALAKLQLLRSHVVDPDLSDIIIHTPRCLVNMETAAQGGCDLEMESRDARDASGSMAHGRDEYSRFREGDAR